MFSVLILTLNEEQDLPRCLQSLGSIQDVAILDSGSKDRTVEIARVAGARVFSRPFDNFAGQRNWAQREIPFRHPWVFHLDADEQLTPELATECRGATARSDIDGFYVAPKMLWCGRWIPRCTDYPAWQARFVRTPEFEFVEVGHGQREAGHMRMGYLKQSYLHDLSSGGEAEWLEKHRRYARTEAQRHATLEKTIRWKDLFSPDALVRRRALKQASYALPARPFLRFLYQYLLRRGFLDGSAGWEYCRLLAQYEGFVGEEMRKIVTPCDV